MKKVSESVSEDGSGGGGGGCGANNNNKDGRIFLFFLVPFLLEHISYLGPP